MKTVGAPADKTFTAVMKIQVGKRNRLNNTDGDKSALQICALISFEVFYSSNEISFFFLKFSHICFEPV